MIESGKIGFLLTVVGLLVMAATFGAMALTGTTGVLPRVALAAVLVAGAGHFMLGGAEFRAKMLADKKKRRK